MPKRLCKWARNAVLAFISLLLALTLAELAVRALAPQQLVRLRPDLWIPHDGLGWRHDPNVDTRVNTGAGSIRFRTDEHGHRIGPRPPAANGFRVLALGDSFLEALQVQYEETLTARLERRLSRRLDDPVRVVNAGVGGWDPNRYLITAREELGRTPYDAVLVFLYLGNDVVAQRIAHLPPRSATRPAELRRPRDLSPGEWFAAVAYPINQVLEARSHIYVLVRRRARFLLARHRGPAGYPPAMLRDEVAAPRWEITTAICRDIATTAGPGKPTVFVLIPAVYQVDRRASRHPDSVDLDQPARKLLVLFQRQRLRVVDTTPALRDAHSAGGAELFVPGDGHLAPRGHLVVARELEPIVFELLEPRSRTRTSHG